jgi:GT2 family glycosyltransferase
MVTTRHSNTYTNYALSSFVEHTTLQPEDEFILIDNDSAYADLPVECRDRVKVRVNESPRSFAANVNQILNLGRERQASVIFLNNDLIFSRGWFEPLQVEGPFLLSPISNAEVPYVEGEFQCKLGMDLNDYLGKEHLFREVVRRHRNRAQGYMKMLNFPFFAVKIPYPVYSVVGPFDESFGIGGGEDKDYAIRCYLAGFELQFALKSFILHFQGKSTWRGPETRDEAAARDLKASVRFKQKWGEALFEVMTLHDLSKLPPDLAEAYKQGDFKKLITALQPS